MLFFLISGLFQDLITLFSKNNNALTIDKTFLQYMRRVLLEHSYFGELTDWTRKTRAETS